MIEYLASHFCTILLLFFGLLGEKTFWVDFVLLMPTLADEAHPSQVSFFPVIMMAQGNERERKHRSGLIEVLRKAQRHQTRLTSGADKISGYLPFIARPKIGAF